MKKVLSLLYCSLTIMTVLLTVSCGKKDDPAPSTNNGNNNNNGGGSFPVNPYLWVKNIPAAYGAVLYSTTDATVVSSSAWIQVSTTDPNTYSSNAYFVTGGLSNYQCAKTSACIESSLGDDVWTFTSTHRYYYKIETGNWADGFVITHKGYVDVYSDGGMNVVPENSVSTTVEWMKNRVCIIMA